MRLNAIIISLLYVTSFVLLLYVLSTQANSQKFPNFNYIRDPHPPNKRRNPIRDRYFQKPGLCPQNYYLNGTKPGFKHFRYDNRTGGCYLIDEVGPCGKNQIFYRVGNSDYGACDCDHRKRCGRPLLYWPPTDTCYHVNTQGPCKDGFWFIYGLTQKPVCQRNHCLNYEINNPSNHRARKFWIQVNGQCTKTRTRGFCPDKEQVMFFKEGEGYPKCVHPEEASVCDPVRGISRPCWAGQKFDAVHKCRDKVGLWGSEDDH